MDRKNEIFFGALEHEGAERERYLDEACGGDLAVRAGIDKLLRSHERAAGFLESPAIETAIDVESVGDLAPGSLVGSFRILERLGTGGMGSVYLAERADAPFEQRVAIKVIRLGLERPDVRQRFLNEQRILASLEHSNIARLIDGGETEGGRPYLVMEHVRGTPIDMYCNERGLDATARLELFLAVCDAVEHAHRHLVVHRDLKPSNILVTEEGEVKLLDFGISKVLEPDAGSSDLTQTGMRALTPRYASPEQIRQDPITTSSDVYGLGVVLYELLTGSHPFAGADTTPGDLERAICDTDPQKPSERVRGGAVDGDSATRSVPRDHRRLAGDLDTIVLMALRKEPERRYTSVADLARDIRSHLSGLPVAARPSTWRYRTGKLVRRHPAAVAAVVALIAGAATSSWLAVRAAQQRAEAVRQAGIAAEVIRFLNEDLLAQADPYNEEDRSIELREVVERASEGLEDRFTDKPHVEAAIRHTLGKTFENLGEYDAAEGHYRRAIELLEPLADDKVTRGELIKSWADLGGLRYVQGRYEEALETLKPLVDADLAEDDPVALVASNTLALAYDGLGQADQAIPAMEASVRRHRRVLGDEHAETLMAANNLALMYQESDRFDESGALLDEVLTARRRTLGDRHPDTILSMMSVGHHLNLMRELERAETVLREAVELGGPVLGEDHPWHAANMYLLGDVLRSLERPDEALDFTLEAYTRQRNSLGEDHPLTLQSKLGLALVYSDLGRHEEAIETSAAVVAARKAALGPMHVATISGMRVHALSERRAGRCDRVMERVTPLLGELRAAHPEGNRSFALLLCEVGACLGEAGRAEEGIAMLGEAHERLVTAVGEDHEATLKARASLEALRESR